MVRRAGCAIGNTSVMAVDGGKNMAVGADSALLDLEGWREAGDAGVRREEVVDDILDEDALTLRDVSSPSTVGTHIAKNFKT